MDPLERPKMNKQLRRGLSFLTATLFVLLLFIVIFIWSLYTTLTSDTTYERVMRETNLAERSRGMIANLIFSAGLITQNNQAPVYFQNISMQSWERVAEAAFPTNWISENLGIILHSITVWFIGSDGQDPEILIDLLPVKAALSGPAGVNAILPLLQDVPTCPESNTEIQFYGAERVLSCWPAEKSLIEPARKIADDTAAILPDQITLEDMKTQNIIRSESLISLMKLRTQIQKYTDWLLIGLGIDIFLLCIYGMLLYSPLEVLLRRLAYPLYVTGGMLLGVTFAWHSFIQWGLSPLLAGLLSDLTVAAQTLLQDIINSLTVKIEQLWITWAIALLASGVAFHVLSAGLLIWKKRQSPKSATTQVIVKVKKQIR
jgi:hypothetical protein